MLIDTHCHFDFEPFCDEVNESITRFKRAGIGQIIVPCVSRLKFDDVLTLAKNHDEIYFAIGLHPFYEHHPNDLTVTEQVLKSQNPKLVAIGEIGLDALTKNMNLDEQITLLKAQLTLAKTYNKPVILHSYKTHSTLYSLLKSFNLPKKGVIHGFTGSYQEAMAFIKLGYYIGVGGTISYPRASKTKDAIKRAPLTHLVLETDAPNMPLMGFQGEPNRPERLASVLASLTQLRDEPADEIDKAVTQNSKQLFELN